MDLIELAIEIIEAIAGTRTERVAGLVGIVIIAGLLILFV